jgi:hypothetical protein
MSDRRERLQRVASDVLEYDCVDDAFLAKSFTDRLLILDIEQGEAVPDPVLETLRENDLRAIESVYGEDGETRSVVGDLDDVTRHHFVDGQTRGSHQSYVIEQ